MTFMRDWSKKLGHGKSDGTDRWPDGLFLPPLHPEATEDIRKDIMDTKRKASDDNVSHITQFWSLFMIWICLWVVSISILSCWWQESISCKSSSFPSSSSPHPVTVQVLQTFWKNLMDYYKPKGGKGQILTDDFWTPNWTGRAREYRLLVEPVDIANWYVSDIWEKTEGPDLESHSVLIQGITIRIFLSLLVLQVLQ